MSRTITAVRSMLDDREVRSTSDRERRGAARARARIRLACERTVVRRNERVDCVHICKTIRWTAHGREGKRIQLYSW